MLVTGVTGCLPYLDSPPSEEQLSNARKLLEEDLQKQGTNLPKHPLLDELITPSKSYATPALLEEMNRLENDKESSSSGIDLSRYTELQFQDETLGKSLLKLPQAFTSLSYAQSRLESLQLAMEYGKNQWLIGNDILEQQVKQMELDLEMENRAVEQVNRERKQRQTDVETTFKYLESRWRSGIQGVIDVNLACLGLEQEVDEMRQGK